MPNREWDWKRWSTATFVSAACIAWALVVGGGCGSRFQGGLANAPSIERPSSPRFQHDVVANSRESCPRSDAGDKNIGRVADSSARGRRRPTAGRLLDD
jgi:hypothetical protein